NIVLSVMEDHNGNMWFGTNNGISVFNGNAFINFTTREGLSADAVTTITEDENGEIWIGTINGLSRMVFKTKNGICSKNDSSYSFPLIINYGKQDGLNGTNFYHNCVIDSKNRIWYGSGKNLTMLDLNNFRINTDPPKVQLYNLEIKGQDYDFHTALDSLGQQFKYKNVASYHNYPVNLGVPYKYNHLTFHFSAIDWSAPHKLLYSYKIEGVDNIWSAPSPEAKADYRNLRHGSHTFKVCAIGEAQVWSEPFEYSFTILPPWYDTWLARISYVLLIFLLILVSVRWRTAKMKVRQNELETKITYATQEIREQKDEVEAQRDEIEAQRDEIEAQRDDLKTQRDLVMVQKQDITDSINYAKRIQTAVLPGQNYMDEMMPEHFVLFHPRDIVSGDFYWIKCIKNFLIIAVVDCTGHGVPGGFMSMLGISLLNEQVGRSRFDKPGEILDRLRRKVKDTLAQEGKLQEQKDGMDMALIILDIDSKEVQYAGA
ncbi:MAG: SpoIIE family protein phosphatase, partial [Bacteroidales bacterium]|nr:SpoIIE family protein phosphatase [Bacteroidales bacterium]